MPHGFAPADASTSAAASSAQSGMLDDTLAGSFVAPNCMLLLLLVDAPPGARPISLCILVAPNLLPPEELDVKLAAGVSVFPVPACAAGAEVGRSIDAPRVDATVVWRVPEAIWRLREEIAQPARAPAAPAALFTSALGELPFSWTWGISFSVTAAVSGCERGVSG